jgi:hypothetical protein
MQEPADGNLSAYDAEDLAREIGYTGDAAAMLRALKDTGYIDSAGMIVGWSELFGLAASRARSAKKAAAARWSRPPIPPSNPEENKSRGEDHALPDAMRDASKHTLADLRSRLPNIDVDDELKACQAKHPRAGMRYFAEEWLPRAEPPIMVTRMPPVARHAGSVEPNGWQAFIDENLPESAHATGNDQFGPWQKKDAAAREQIRRLMTVHQQPDTSTSSDGRGQAA